jgi:hypothetical protein
MLTHRPGMTVTGDPNLKPISALGGSPRDLLSDTSDVFYIIDFVSNITYSA